jgi:DNA-binding LacI/PurR family transcriptional regulator
VLAKNMGISRNTLRSALTKLADDRFIDRMCSKGTMVCDRGCKNLQVPLTFLLKCTDYISNVSMHPDSQYMGRMLSGFSQIAYKNNYRTEIVPVSPTNYQLDIDWQKVDHLNSSSMVMVGGFWYKTLFPLLAERGCKVILIDEQTCDGEIYSDYLKNWFLIKLKRAEAASAAVEYMHSLGQNRIALVHAYISEKDHPVFNGYLSGIKKCGLDYSAWLETPDKLFTAKEIIKTISDFYNKTNFDTLMINAYILLPLCRQPFLNRTLGLPDSVKILMLNNLEHLFNTYPSPWWTDFPWMEIGRCGAAALIQEASCQTSTSFDALIIKDRSVISDEEYGNSSNTQQQEFPEDIADSTVTADGGRYHTQYLENNLTMNEKSPQGGKNNNIRLCRGKLLAGHSRPFPKTKCHFEVPSRPSQNGEP